MMNKLVLFFFIVTVATATVAAIDPPSFTIDRYVTFWPTIDVAETVCRDMYYWAAPSSDRAGLEMGLQACLFLFKVTRGLDQRFVESLRWYYMPEQQQQPVTCLVYSTPVQLAKIAALMISNPDPAEQRSLLPISAAQLDQQWVDTVCGSKTQPMTMVSYDPTALRLELLRSPFQCKFHTDVVVVDFEQLNQRQQYVMNTIDAMKLSVGSIIFDGKRPIKDLFDALLCARIGLVINRIGGSAASEAVTEAASFLQQLLEQNSIRVIRESSDYPYNHLARIVANELKRGAS